MDETTNWTELLEKEYGQDEVAAVLIREFRTEDHKTDKEIYQILESFY